MCSRSFKIISKNNYFFLFRRNLVNKLFWYFTSFYNRSFWPKINFISKKKFTFFFSQMAEKEDLTSEVERLQLENADLKRNLQIAERLGYYYFWGQSRFRESFSLLILILRAIIILFFFISLSFSLPLSLSPLSLFLFLTSQKWPVDFQQVILYYFWGQS